MSASSTSTTSSINGTDNKLTGINQGRPYYNKDTFNIGYVAKFNPDKGVIDSNGDSIASKLSIANQNRQNFIGGATGKNGSNRLGSLTGLSTGYYGSTNGSNILRLNISQLFNIKKWDFTMWKFLLRQYFKNLLQQPFETCKIIMQITSIEKPKKDSINSETSSIDYFPVREEEKIPKAEDSTEEEDNIDDEFVTTNSNTLQLKKLTTWNVIHSMRSNGNFGIRSLWRSNNITFFSNFCKKCLLWGVSRFISPFYYYYNFSFSTIVSLKILMNFATDLILLPLDLYKLKLIISNNSNKSNDEPWSFNKLLRLHNYWDFTLDDKTIRLFFLILLRIACHKFFNNGLEFMIYYWLNFTNLNNNKILLILSLKLITEFCEFFIKLPIETLLRRYQVDYLLSTKDIESKNQLCVANEDLIIKPINVNTIELWQGLWNGWKIGLMSLICGFGFKIMSNIDDDLEQERF